jgi:hypothetical protein
MHIDVRIPARTALALKAEYNRLQALMIELQRHNTLPATTTTT